MGTTTKSKSKRRLLLALAIVVSGIGATIVISRPPEDGNRELVQATVASASDDLGSSGR